MPAARNNRLTSFVTSPAESGVAIRTGTLRMAYRFPFLDRKNSTKSSTLSSSSSLRIYKNQGSSSRILLFPVVLAPTRFWARVATCIADSVRREKRRAPLPHV
jgi:hypothetical protein